MLAYVAVPFALVMLARAVKVAPHVALLFPALAAVGGVAMLASAIPG